MAKTAMIRARVEPELKEQVESIFEQIGLSATDAITLFYKQVLIQQRIPFELSVAPQAKRQSIRYDTPPEVPTASIRERPNVATINDEAEMIAHLRKVVEKSPILTQEDLEAALENADYFTDDEWYVGAWADVPPEHWKLFERSSSSKRREQLDHFFKLE